MAFVLRASKGAAASIRTAVLSNHFLRMNQTTGSSLLISRKRDRIEQHRSNSTTRSEAGPMGGLGRLAAGETAVFVCDVQERFRSVISGYPAVVDVARRMALASKELNLPVIVTEQYPKALGNTVTEVAEVLPEGSMVVAKTDFSMVVPDVEKKLEALGPHVKNILLLGIETQVCVLQTTIDLIGTYACLTGFLISDIMLLVHTDSKNFQAERGYNVHILVDGVSSQRLGDRAAALHRLSQMGAYMATSGEYIFGFEHLYIMVKVV